VVVITASVDDVTTDDVTTSVTLEVVSPRVAVVDIVLPPSSIHVGDRVQLVVHTYDKHRDVLKRAVAWLTSDADVAGVSDAGVLHARRAGLVVVFAEAEGRRGSVELPIAPARVARLTPTIAPARLRVGNRIELGATPFDAQGNLLHDRVVTWSSADTAVATITAEGTVVARAPGHAKFTGICDGRSAVVEMRVESPMAAPELKPPANRRGDFAAVVVPYVPPPKSPSRWRELVWKYRWPFGLASGMLVVVIVLVWRPPARDQFYGAIGQFRAAVGHGARAIAGARAAPKAGPSKPQPKETQAEPQPQPKATEPEKAPAERGRLPAAGPLVPEASVTARAPKNVVPDSGKAKRTTSDVGGRKLEAQKVDTSPSTARGGFSRDTAPAAVPQGVLQPPDTARAFSDAAAVAIQGFLDAIRRRDMASIRGHMQQALADQFQQAIASALDSIVPSVLAPVYDSTAAQAHFALKVEDGSKRLIIPPTDLVVTFYQQPGRLIIMTIDRKP
jgi:hypothetical protein